MSRAKAYASVREAERVAAPALARGRVETRDEWQACHALSRLWLRGLGNYRDQQGHKAWYALPPLNTDYSSTITGPQSMRRIDMWKRKSRGIPGWHFIAIPPGLEGAL